MARRVKVDGLAVYHCMSRTVAGERLWDSVAKEVLRKMIWEVADFSGVEVLAYCVMSNHFHVLVRVAPEQAKVERGELLRRYRCLYDGRSIPDFPTGDEMAKIFADDGEEARQWEARLRARMGDVSAYLKTLKQRFSGWFNKTHDRFGTLWAERFRSVLVEDSDLARQTVAAYIDLNPVRAGLVQDPAAYRWCSYAEAVSGRKEAERAVERVMGKNRCFESGQSALAAYRMVLFGWGGESPLGEKGVISEKLAERIRNRKGAPSRCELLRCRVRYFSSGLVIGSESFVRSIGDQLERKTNVSGRTRAKLLGQVAMQIDAEGAVSERLVSWRRLTSAVTVPATERSQV